MDLPEAVPIITELSDLVRIEKEMLFLCAKKNKVEAAKVCKDKCPHLMEYNFLKCCVELARGYGNNSFLPVIKEMCVQHNLSLDIPEY